MKILVACPLPESALEELRALGGTVVHEPDLTPEELPRNLDGVGMLIVSRLRVGQDALSVGRSLQMIVHAGAGTAEIEVDHASALGIFVTHWPDRDALAAAELAVGLLLALDRGLAEARSGAATRGRRGVGLSGAALGILGENAAAHELESRATSCGMTVLRWAPHGPDGDSPARRICRSRRELAARADFVVSFGARADHEPRLDSEFFESLRPGAAFVHIGPVAVLDEAALLRAAGSGKHLFALDLPEFEVSRDAARLGVRLSEIPGVIVSQGLAARTRQAELAIADEVVRVARQYLASGQLVNCVNLLERSPATWQLVLRLRDAVGVMAGIMDAIRADGINAEEITSRVFTGARAAWCTIALDERPSAEGLAAIRALDGVLHLELRAVV